MRSSHSPGFATSGLADSIAISNSLGLLVYSRSIDLARLAMLGSVQSFSHFRPSLLRRKVVGLLAPPWGPEAKRSGDGGDVGQSVHLQVAFGAPLCCGNLSQPGSDKHQCRVPVWKRTDHSRSSTNLPHQPFQRVVGPPPVDVAAHPKFTHSPEVIVLWIFEVEDVQSLFDQFTAIGLHELATMLAALAV